MRFNTVERRRPSPLLGELPLLILTTLLPLDVIKTDDAVVVVDEDRRVALIEVETTAAADDDDDESLLILLLLSLLLDCTSFSWVVCNPASSSFSSKRIGGGPLLAFSSFW